MDALLFFFLSLFLLYNEYQADNAILVVSHWVMRCHSVFFAVDDSSTETSYLVAY